MQLSLPQDDPYGRPERRSFCTDLAREAATVPGVTKVSAINFLPLSGASADRFFTIEGQPEVPMEQGPFADYRSVCHDYFATLSIPLVSGRDFDVRDATDAPLVAVVNRALVE